MHSTLRQSLLGRLVASRITSFHNGKGRPLLNIRQLSSSSINTSKAARPALISTSHTGRSIIGYASSIRLLSTSSAGNKSAIERSTIAPDVQAAETSPFLPESPPQSTDLNAWDAGFPESFATNGFEPHIGMLKELGIDHGFGFTSTVQWITENWLVYSGLPWWACLIASTLTIRVLIFPLFLKNANNSAKLSAILPSLQPYTEMMKQAQATGDQQMMFRAYQQQAAIRRRAGASMTAPLLPIFVQVGFGIGAFRLGKGMAAASVPGMEDGGLLWFSDLTVPDPIFGLPVITAVIMWLSMKKGSELGVMSPQQRKTMTFMARIFPPLSLLFTSWFPAAINVQFFAASCVAYLQTTAFQSNKFRSAMGMTLITRRPETSTPEAYAGTVTRYAPIDTTVNQTPKTTIGKIRDTVSDPRKKLREGLDNFKDSATRWSNEAGLPGAVNRSKKGRLTEQEKARADRYEEQRRLEIEQEKTEKRRRRGKHAE